MWVLATIGIILDAVPIVRRLWRWIWEHNMELELREPHSQIVRGDTGLNIPDGTSPIFTVNTGEKPYVYMWCDLVITNHNKDRPEVITNCKLHLKMRHRLLWEKTIASAPVLIDTDNRGVRSKQKAWKPVRVRRFSLPKTIPVMAQGDITYPIEKLPRKMRLVLEFHTVGLHRRIKKAVCSIIDGELYCI
jgi:hypothetical protein